VLLEMMGEPEQSASQDENGDLYDEAGWDIEPGDSDSVPSYNETDYAESYEDAESEYIPSYGVMIPKDVDFADFEPPLATRSAREQPGPSEEEAPPLMRYPAIDCPAQTELGERFSLYVQLLLDAPTPAAQAMAIADRGGPANPPEIELVLRAPGFELVGGVNTRQLVIDRSDDSEERFVLIPRQLGDQVIRVDFYQHGRRLGTERCQVRVIEQGAERLLMQPLPPAGPLEEPVLLALSAKPTIPPADLEIVVQVERSNPQNLNFELHTMSEEIGYHRFNAGECSLSGLPLERMQALYNEVSKLTRSQSRHFGSSEEEEPPISPDEASRRLARLGNQLWDELIPEKMKAEYWKFKDKVKTVLITSDEPWVPWEMIKPYRFDDQEGPLDEPFWCQQFAISRWLSGQGPADLLSMETARSIAPLESDLPAIVDEIAFLNGLPALRPGLHLLEPLHALAEVRDWLENGQFSVLHFACHGMFDSEQPMNSGILLTGGALRPSDIRVRFGGSRPRPLIFINACHGGRIENSFTGLGGWATKMVEARAGAFVGALWEVDDNLALTFARSFYTALLLDNQPLAEAFRLAREEIRLASPNNSTWLAYVLYADPECRVFSSS
jgi:hypothetical protein